MQNLAGDAGVTPAKKLRIEKCYAEHCWGRGRHAREKTKD